MRVAIIHYWLVGMRGGERVLEELCKIYPNADVYTHVLRPSAIEETILRQVKGTTFINNLPWAASLYKKYLPFMPLALEQIDLRAYDLIISSEAGPAKGIIPRADAVHVCYCHSPMRYIWSMYYEYKASASAFYRFLIPVVSHYLRTCDLLSATRVHDFVANSQGVQQRISTYYGRKAVVIHPPVRTDYFVPVSDNAVGDFYLLAGELVGYKRPDLAIAAARQLKRKLVVIGGGELLARIRRETAGDKDITILGPQPLEKLKWYYARCRALLFPGEEDFGIVPVEAMASGRPVVAFRRGGVSETVCEGVTGHFFDEQTADAMATAIEEFEQMVFDAATIAEHAKSFSAERFRDEFKTFVDSRLKRATATPTLHPTVSYQKRRRPAIAIVPG